MDILIDTYGTKVGSTGERIILTFPGTKEKKEYPIRRIRKIVILRPASITTHAVKLALDHDVDIVYLGSFGKPVGRVFSSEPRGLASMRRAQLEVSTSTKSFDVARMLVKGKCANQINYLRYLGYKYKKDFSREILQMETIFGTIDNLPQTEKGKEQLLGIEGYIADRYFFCLKTMYRFPGRKPQGRDRFNSALNYGYGILYNEVERSCLYVGLDPYLGLYHSDRYGKPALVLDLVEEFRVPVVDSIVFPLFLDGKLTKKSCFEMVDKGQYQLSQEGKQILVAAVLERLNSKILWGGKHYTIKQIIENQVRMLGHYFMGKQKQYLPFDMSALIPLS